MNHIYIKCDNCNDETRDYLSKDWLRVRIKSGDSAIVTLVRIGSQKVAFHEPVFGQSHNGGEGYDFCCSKCLHEFIDKALDRII